MSDHGVYDAHRTILDGLDLGHLAGHGISLVAILGVFTGVLPALAALGAVIWYMISIYETRTFQSWRARQRAKKRLARFVLLKGKAAERRKEKTRLQRQADHF